MKRRSPRAGSSRALVDLDAACNVSYVDPAAKAKTRQPGNLTSIVRGHP